MKERSLMIVAAMLVMMSLILSACGGTSKTVDLKDSRYVGTWKAKDLSIRDIAEDLDEEWILVLNEDGTGTFTGTGESGEEETSEFTWKPVDGGFKTSGDVKLTFKEDGDLIKTKIIGVDMTFEKQ